MVLLATRASIPARPGQPCVKRIFTQFRQSRMSFSSNRSAVRMARALLVSALALAGLTCRDSDPMGPGLPTRTSLSIAPHFNVVDGGPLIQLTTARVRVFRITGTTRTMVRDTVASFVPGSEALSLNITVPVMGGQDDFEVIIEAMDAAGNIIYSATETMTVAAGAAPETPSAIELDYVAPDTAVASLRVEPRDTVLTANEPFTFRAIGRRSDNSVIATNVGWKSGDPAKFVIDQATGTGRALSQFANVAVIATTARGKADTTFVSATQAVAQVAVSPATSSFFVGSTQQLSAQVSAAGGVPLPTRPVHWTSDDASIATVSSTGLVTGVAIGTTTIRAASGGQSGSATVTITKRAPTITWATPADITFGTPLGAAQLNATASFEGVPVPGTFIYLPPAGTVLQTGTRTLGATFTPTDAATYASAIAAVTINVLKASQTITFAPLPDRVFGEADFTLTATASSGLTVTYSAAGACTVSGSTVHLTGGGSCAITASQPGDANYEAAPNVVQTFQISRATLSVTVASATGVFNGTTNLSATVTAGGVAVPDMSLAFFLNGTNVGTAVSNSSGVAALTNVSLSGINAGTYEGALSPSTGVVATFAGNDDFTATSAVATLLVTKATATLALGTLNFVYDGTPKSVTVITTPADLSGVSVTYNGLTTPPSDAGSYSVVASLANANYQAADITGNMVIGRVDQTISFGALSDRRLGDPDFEVSATATSGLAVSFTASGSCTVTGTTVSLVSEGQCTITASQAGNANYNAAPSVAQTFNVGPRPVASVEVSPTSAVVEVNQSVLFTATPKDDQGQPLTGRQIDWSSANVDVATVTNGLVTGVTVGQTTITAIVEGKTATATVDVQAPPPQVTSTILVSAEHDTLFSIGAKRLLVAQSYNGEELVPGTYTWSSTDPAIVEVDNFGLAIAKANGTAQVIVTESGGTADTTEVVVLQKLAKIMVTPALARVTVGGTTTLTATGYDGLGTAMSLPGQVRWHKLDYWAEQAEVDSITGVVTGAYIGNLTIAARSGELEGRALIEVVSLVSRVEITPGAVTLTALGQTQTYSAVAYDFNNAVISGANVDWESQNETVARVTAISGGVATVTSLTNGMAMVRAMVQGSWSEVPLTVAQQLDHITVSPSTLNLNVGGMSVLAASGFDANNRALALAPGSVTWASSDPSVTVESTTGVVTAATSGSAVVTASTGSGGSIQSSATVTVNTSLLGSIAFGTQKLSVAGGDTVAVKIYLNTNPGQSFSVTLGVTDTIAYWQNPTVNFGPGVTSATAQLIGRFAGTTTVTATDDRGIETGYASGSAVLAVHPVAMFAVDQNTMLAGDEFSTKLRLSEPAPAGGAVVTFQYSSPGVLQVEPATVFVPAGQIASDIVVRGVSAGISTVSPVLHGVSMFTSEPMEIVPAQLKINFPTTARVIGAGQFEFGMRGYFYEEDHTGSSAQRLTRAQRGPGRVKSSANPSAGTSTAPTVRIPTGPGQWADYYYGGSCGDSGEGGEGYSSEMEYDAGEGYTATIDYCLAVGADPQKPLPVTLTSSNSSVLLVEENLEMSSRNKSFGVYGRTPGSVTVTASVPNWPSASMPVIVSTPRLSAYAYGGVDYEGHIMLRDSTVLWVDVAVNDSLGYEHPLVNSLRVRVSSSDPTVFRVADSIIVIEAGESYSYGNVSVVPTGSGKAWLQIRTDGHVSDSIMVEAGAQELIVDREVLIGAGQSGTFNVRTGRVGSTALPVSFVSLTDTSSAAISPSVSINTTVSESAIDVRGYSPGTTSFVVSADGFAPETISVVVSTPRLVVTGNVPMLLPSPPRTLQIVTADSLGNWHYTLSNVVVSLRMLDTTIATVQEGVTLGAGSSYGQFQVTGANFGTTYVVAEAAGYTPDTAEILVQRGKLVYQNERPAIGVAERLYYYYQPYVYVPATPAAGDSIVLHIEQKQPAVISLAGNRFVRYNGTSYDGARLNMAGLSVGTDTLIVQDSLGMLLPDTLIVSVTPAPFLIDRYSGTDIEQNVATISRNVTIDWNSSYGASVAGSRVVMKVETSDSAVMRPDVEYVAIEAGYTSNYVNFTAIGAGKAWMIVRDSAGLLTPDSVLMTVHRPRLKSSYPVVSLGVGQSTNEWDGGHVMLDTYRETETVVTLTSSDPTVASVPASITIPAYYSDWQFAITAHDTVGVVRIKMEAAGLEPGYFEVDVRRPRLEVYLDQSQDANTSETITVQSRDWQGYLRNVNAPVVLTLSSTDAAIAGTDSTQITIPAGQSQHTSTTLFYRTPGRVELSIHDSRYPALNGFKSWVGSIEVTRPQFSTSYPYAGYLGPRQVDTMTVYIPNYAVDPLTVNVSSSDPAIASVPATTVIPAGAYFVKVPVFGHAEGSSTISVSAPGYLSTTWPANVTKGYATVTGSISNAVGDTSIVYLTIQRPNNGPYGITPINLHQTTTFTLDGKGVARFMPMDATTEITTISADSGAYQTAQFRLVFIDTGAVTLEVRHPDFQTSSVSTTIAPPMTATVEAVGTSSFNPLTALVRVNGTVTFSNPTTVDHNVIFDDVTGAPVAINPLSPGTSASRQFVQAGTFNYRCEIHPQMTGTVEVRTQ